LKKKTGRLLTLFEVHVYAKAPAFFHELSDEASLVGIVALPELRLLIQQYFNIMDYVVSPYGQ
jgi:hypothetical protein